MMIVPSLPLEDSAWVDLAPCGVPFYEGGDWWATKVNVPKDGFEMNFIFTDGEGQYENNSGNDFMLPVHLTLKLTIVS